MLYLRFPELAREPYSVPFSRQHIGRLVRAGKFPAPIPLGENTVAWSDVEILDWQAKRMQARSMAAVTDAAAEDKEKGQIMRDDVPREAQELRPEPSRRLRSSP